MNTFKQRSVSGCESNHRALPVIALGNAALDIVWHPRISDTRTLEQRAIDRWENEGGEIPNEQRNTPCCPSATGGIIGLEYDNNSRFRSWSSLGRAPSVTKMCLPGIATGLAFNFMILKTYSRIFTGDMDLSLRFLEHLTGPKPDCRFRLPEMGIEVSGLADFCVVAGSKEKLDPLRGSQGPLIVDDLAATEKFLVGAGAVITKPNQATVTGRNLFARHPDGSVLEYVEWKPELRLRILG